MIFEIKSLKCLDSKNLGVKSDSKIKTWLLSVSIEFFELNSEINGSWNTAMTSFFEDG